MEEPVAELVHLPPARDYRHWCALRIPRAGGDDDYGLLYVGETGIKNTDPSYRGEKLGRGVIDQAFGTGAEARHCQKFWAETGIHNSRLLTPTTEMSFGWDRRVEETILANKNERLPQSQQKDQTITNSGKGLAMNMEDEMIREYEGRYREWPPLNSADSPGLRDRDRKTKRDVSQDTEDIG